MSEVPSNLIPFRVTQLPLAPEASPDGILLYTLNGVSYQITAGQLLAVSGVPLTRQVIAGTGLTGGGQLSSNVTLSVAAGGIGDTQLNTTGVAAGIYGSASEVPVFQVSSKGRIESVTSTAINLPGKVNTTTQVIAGVGLSGGGALSSNITLNADLSNATPLSGNTTGAAGTSKEISRSNHRHPAVNLGSDDEVDGVLRVENGGLGSSIVPAPGAMLWCGADAFYLGPAGLNGQVLVSGGEGAYTWGSALIETDRPANFVYAGPASGPDAPTSFRLLVNADIPSALSGKTLDNSPIGATTANTVRGTTITATTQFTGPGTGLTGTAGSLSIGGNAATATSATTAGSATTATTATNLAGGAEYQIPYQSAAGATTYAPAPTISNTFLRFNGTGFDWQDVTLGFVSSVAFSAGTTGFSVTGSPITDTGTIEIGGTLVAAHGGTGFNSYTVGDILYASGSTALSKLALGTLGHVMTAGASAPVYTNPNSLTVGNATTAANATQVTVTDDNANATRYITFSPGTSGSNALGVDASTTPLTYNPASNLISANISGNAATATTASSATTAATATKATNLAGGNASQIPYQTALDTTGFIPNGSMGQVLTSQGTGTPTWSGLDGGTF